MRRVPIEYGDNFPVPSGSWNPTVPWRFPRQEEGRSFSPWFSRALPWMMLGLGLGLGVLWMSWRVEPPQLGSSRSMPEEVPAVGVSTPHGGKAGQVVPAEGIPKNRPVRTRSRLA